LYQFHFLTKVNPISLIYTSGTFGDFFSLIFLQSMPAKNG
jgi:hypothetical protein